MRFSENWIIYRNQENQSIKQLKILGDNKNYWCCWLSRVWQKMTLQICFDNFDNLDWYRILVHASAHSNNINCYYYYKRFLIQWYPIQLIVCLSAINLFDLLDRNLYAAINQEANRIFAKVFERKTNCKLNIGTI